MPAELAAYEDVSAPCERVEQQTAFYCGAACCKMVLDVYHIPIVQAEAYSLAHDDARFATEQLYSDPIGISNCLNVKTPNDIDFDVKAYAAADKQLVIDQIYFTVKFLKIPCLVLVQKGNHWVVIDSVRIKEKETGARELTGVFIQNPWFGSSPNKYLPIEEFLSGWLTPVQWGVTWKDQLVIMSDGKQHTLQTINMMRSGPRLARPTNVVEGVHVGQEHEARHYAGAAIAGPLGVPGGDARALAKVALSEHGFGKISEIQGGGAALLNPIAVQCLDGEPSYSIVPMDGGASPEFNDFVYVAIDDASGSLLEVARFGNALQVYTDGEALQEVKSAFPNAVKIEIASGYYWRRSFSAMSRFQVLRKISIDGKAMFMLSDGSVTPTLDETPVAGG